MEFAHFSQFFNKPNLRGYDRYEQMWRELQLADEVGFDYAFQSIHHAYKLRPTPAIFCTGGAARTKQIHLGPMGYISPLYDPFRIVEETALLDQVTNGRFELGMVIGVYPEYFRIYKGDVENRRELGMEAIRLVKTAFGTEGNFSFEGPFHQYEDVELAIRPIQKPHPRIWWPSQEPSTLEFCAQEGVHTGYIHLQDRSEMAPRLREYWRNWQKAGHSEQPKINYASFVYVDETDEAALRKGMEYILVNTVDNYGNSPKGGIFKESVEGAGPRTAEIFQRKAEMDFLMENNLVFVGSPETVTKKIKEAAEEGFFNVLSCECNLGEIPEEDLMRSIRLFGTEVIPALKHFDPTRP